MKNNYTRNYQFSFAKRISLPKPTVALLRETVSFSSNIANFIKDKNINIETRCDVLRTLPPSKFNRVRSIVEQFDPGIKEVFIPVFKRIVSDRNNVVSKKDAAANTAKRLEQMSSSETAEILNHEGISPYEVSKILMHMKASYAAETVGLMGIEKAAIALGHGSLTIRDTVKILAQDELPDETALQILFQMSAVVFASILSNGDMPIGKGAYCLNYDKMPKEKIKAAINHKDMGFERLMWLFAHDNMMPCSIARITAIEGMDIIYKIMDSMSMIVLLKKATGTIPREIMEVPGSKLAEILNDEQIPIDRAAWILNHRNMPLDKAASVINSLSVPRAAAIITSKNIDQSRLQRIASNDFLTEENAFFIEDEAKKINPNLIFAKAKQSDLIAQFFVEPVSFARAAAMEDVKKKPEITPKARYASKSVAPIAKQDEPEKTDNRIGGQRQNGKDIENYILESKAMNRYFLARSSNWRELPMESLRETYKDIMLNSKKMEEYFSGRISDWKNMPLPFLADIFNNIE